MFGMNRWNPFDDFFSFQRDIERMFDQVWSELPARTAAARTNSFQVKANDDGWRIDVPIPGIDPQHVNLDVAGHTVTLRATEPADDKSGDQVRYEQSFTVPQFLDIDKMKAAYRHGILQLTVPLKESVKPRRIQIETTGEQKQLAAA
jgi:HSP20 family protein